MLEADACDTPNEAIWLSRKFGRVGLIGVYAAFTNGFNIGAVMEKGVRFIGNGQAPVHLCWEELLHDYILAGKFDPRFMISHRVDIEDFEELYQRSGLPGLTSSSFRPRRGELRIHAAASTGHWIQATLAWTNVQGFVAVTLCRVVLTIPPPGEGCPQLTRVSDWAQEVL
jgi:hypothetical protein